jgi:hypothetical protein
MLPLLEDEFNNTGTLTIGFPEPKWIATDGFQELGYAIELQLFSGILNFPQPRTNILSKQYSKHQANSVVLTTIDIKGRAIGVHRMTKHALMVVTDPMSCTAGADGAFPEIVLELTLGSGERMPTVLSRQEADSESSDGPQQALATTSLGNKGEVVETSNAQAVDGSSSGSWTTESSSSTLASQR